MNFKNSTSIEDSFKINDKLFKLNPLEVTYDEKNLMNSFAFKTFSNFENQENNKAEFLFISHKYDVFKFNYLFFSEK